MLLLLTICTCGHSFIKAFYTLSLVFRAGLTSIFGIIMTDKTVKQESIDRLRKLIDMSIGESWDDKVKRFAVEQGRSRSSCYRWLTSGPPLLVLEGIEYRITRNKEDMDKLFNYMTLSKP